MRKEIAVTDRARSALESTATEQALAALSAKHSDLISIKSSADLRLAKSALSEFRSTRISIEKAGKDARDDANAFAKAVIAEQRRLIDIIHPEEKRIRRLRGEYEAEAACIKAEAERIENERVDLIRKKIAAFSDAVFDAAGAPSQDIERALGGLREIEIGDDFAEFKDEAATELAKAKRRLEELHDEAEALAGRRAEQERIAAELKVQQDDIERERRMLAEERAQVEIAEAVKAEPLQAPTFEQNLADWAKQYGVSDAAMDALLALIERHATGGKKS